ncbi:MAG: class IV adenylate cyclase [Methanobacterium sp.]|uniref:class IV adenylate cyclase n=1 Tax=Methanobacterium sp. TaxID=2164 RepID=UPI003D662D16|nr:class IV adenylate cyclase [Methanobacterium sp.]
MIEVEVKAHAKNFNDVKRKLEEINAIKTKFEHQKDTYFNNPNYRDFEITDEALRIRNTTTDGKSEIILTYKGAKMDDVSKTRKELEVNVENFQQMSSILENLGFKPVADVEKERTTYMFNEFIISLDNVFKVGKFVEIEKEAAEGEEFEEIIEEIFEIYKKIGIEDGFERKSYLELMGIYKG